MFDWDEANLDHIAAHGISAEEVEGVLVHRLEDIPQFSSEAEEHAFWATHELDEALWDQAGPFGSDELPPPRSATKPVAIRFDEHTLARLKRLARKRHKGTLLKEFVIERLYEEEKREGLLSDAEQETQACTTACARATICAGARRSAPWSTRCCPPRRRPRATYWPYYPRTGRTSPPLTTGPST